MVKKTRNLVQRVQAIYDFMDRSITFSQPIAKSEFQKIGISPKDMDNWIQLIQLIQSMPLLIVKKDGVRTYVDTLESKFMLRVKKYFYDQNRTLIERESALLLYFRTLLTLEKIKGKEVDINELIKSNLNFDRPTIVRIAEEGLSKET